MLVFWMSREFGKVNSEFQAGRKAGDALILDVYSKIMKAGEGKVSVARWGGDEFVFEIAEPDPFKAQAILKKSKEVVKDDLDGPGMQIFKDEKSKASCLSGLTNSRKQSQTRGSR